MDLWIRSQDKKRLIPKPNLDAVYLVGNKCAIISDMKVGPVAKYKTEERAIEVLDEIQNILQPKMKVNTYTFEQKKLLNGTNIIQPILEDIKVESAQSYVYEMPKE